jgi:hypothetical protein
LTNREQTDGAVVAGARDLVRGVKDAGDRELHVALTGAEKHVPEQNVLESDFVCVSAASDVEWAPSFGWREFNKPLASGICCAVEANP